MSDPRHRFGPRRNLYYRLAPPAWGHGLAAELVAEATAAAREVDPALPLVAYLLEHNLESKGRAERAGTDAALV